MQGVDVDEWNAASRGLKLPDKIGKSSTKRKTQKIQKSNRKKVQSRKNRK